MKNLIKSMRELIYRVFNWTKGTPRTLVPRIEQFDGENWHFLKEVKDWQEAIKETYELNSSTNSTKHRAVIDFGDGLTQIYCSSFYLVPTVRFY